MPKLTYDTLQDRVGEEIGVSDWITVDQDRIDRFADCTDDHQWIHVDVEQARRRSPFRSTIAHGYLTLSLVVTLGHQLGAVPEHTQAAFNYGLDRVRFMAPVLAGARVRLRMTMISAEKKGPGQYLVKTSNVLEIEGSEKPALIAEALVMFYERRRRPKAESV